MASEIIRKMNRVVVSLCVAGLGMSCMQEKKEDQAPPKNVAAAPAKPAAPSAASAPAAPAIAATDITGNWKWSVDAGGTTINHSAKFKQTGQTLSGTWTDFFGDQAVTADIKEGTVKDGQVNFKVNRPSPFGDGSEMTLTFSGKLTTDKIDGTINVLIPGGEPSPSEWHAARVKE